MKGKLIKIDEDFSLCIPHETTNEFIATTDGMYTEHKLSLKNCQAIERGYDLYETWEELFFKRVTNTSIRCFDSFKLGFRKALEILGDKKFSEEQMRRAYLLGRGDESIVRDLSASNKEKIQYSENLKKGFDRYIKSLQRTEWNVEIVQEPAKKDIEKGETNYFISKLDADGCLILKRIDNEK